MRLIVHPSIDGIVEEAAELFVKQSKRAMAHHHDFYVGLSGGSTPKKLYELLSSPQFINRIEWSRVHFFMSDERCVPHDDERSNQKLAEDYLLSRLPGIDRTKVHVVHAHLKPELAATEYEQAVRRAFQVSGSDIPSFDLILLGLGSDAHTASLFPGKPALNEQAKLVVSSMPGILPPPVDRVTFTFPLINAAQKVVMMTAGADKAEALAAVYDDFYGSKAAAATPAGRVRPQLEPMIVLADQAAASQIPQAAV